MPNNNLIVPIGKELDFEKDSNIIRPYGNNSKYLEYAKETGIIIKWGDIGEEYYSLTEKPTADRLAAKVAVHETLQGINLPSIAANLESGAMLLNVAYRALDLTGELQNDISGIRLKYENAVRESQSLITQFKDISGKVVDAIIQSNIYLLEKENEKQAYVVLAKCEKLAEKMSQDADTLVKIFDTLQSEVQVVNDKVVLLRTKKSEEKKEEDKAFNEKIAKLKGLQAATKQLQTNLATYQKEYDELQKKIEEIEKKAYKLELTGMIMGAIGNVFSGFTGKTSPASKSSQAEIPGSTQQQPEQPENPELKKKREAMENKEDELNLKTKEYHASLDKIIALESELNIIKGILPNTENKELRELSVVENELKTEQENKANLEKRKAVLEKELQSTKGEYDGLIAGGIGGIGAGLASVKEDTQRMAQNYSDLAKQKSERLDKIMELKIGIENALVTNMGAIAENTAILKNASLDIDDLIIVINSLQIANTSLNMIVAILISIKDFWSKMKLACERLSSPDARERLKELTEDDWNERSEIVKSYKTDGMLGKYLFLNLVRWYAIILICDDYVKGAEQGRQKIIKDLNTPIGSKKEMYEQAKSIATEVENKLGVQIMSKKQYMEDLEEQKKRNQEIADAEAKNKGLGV